MGFTGAFDDLRLYLKVIRHPTDQGIQIHTFGLDLIGSQDYIPEGNVILIRFIRSNRMLDVSGEKFIVSKELVY